VRSYWIDFKDYLFSPSILFSECGFRRLLEYVWSEFGMVVLDYVRKHLSSCHAGG
jgi:hypothetical protein